MQFSTIIVALFAGLATASPMQKREERICSSAIDTTQCCDVSIDGLLELTCETPSTTPLSVNEFKSICHENGKHAACCVLPLLGEGVACTDL